MKTFERFAEAFSKTVDSFVYGIGSILTLLSSIAIISICAYFIFEIISILAK